MQDSSGIKTALAGLFPAHTAISFSAARPAHAELLVGELPATDRMADKRKLEFAHGRWCARSALESLGIPAVAILQGKNREPIWPQGIVGSISHTHLSAAAVAASSSHLAGLGLDMETNEPLADDLIPLICRPDENIDRNGFQAKLLFSIKEAIYKCLYPTIHEFVDFQEMKVCLDTESQRFMATAYTPHCTSELMNRLEGGFRITGGLVLSGAWLNW